MEISQEIKNVLEKLGEAGYEAYIVGGCVRDFLREEKPNDWDITTNATPEEIANVFPKSFYENDFGTVSVITESLDKTLKTIEITPFRVEGKYTDKRHPDEIKFAEKLEDDLSRRDFTVNAMAMSFENNQTEIIDLFKGQADLKDKVIRTVGMADKRFSEDALRLIRAVRFAVCLGPDSWIWEIEEKTKKAIKKNSHLLEKISQERMRDELVKIIMSQNASRGIELLRRLGLLQYILPELESGFNIEQSKHHIYQVYQHNLLSLNYACLHNYSKEVRMAALLHDVAKPQTKKGKAQTATFYNHEIIGAKIAYNALRRLRFPRKEIEKITKLIRWHLFYYNVDEVTEASVRRLLRKVGPEDIEELLQLRKADRIGSGVPKAEPYKLRHLKYLFEKVSQDPIKPTMLKINGGDIMQTLNIKPGPRIGQILDYLLSQVITDPNRNVRENLLQEIRKLGELPDKELEKLAHQANQDLEKIETKKDQMTKAKYWVT